MEHPFSAKLTLVLKALSLSRGQLASLLEVDKSAVGRWLTGAVKPSAHSLAQLSGVVATRVPGFAVVDWDRPLEALAALLGVAPDVAPPSRAMRLAATLPGALVNELLDTTAMRAATYEGFYRSTRPFAQVPGQFIHDHVMIRQAPTGVLGFTMGTGKVFVTGWVLRQQNQLFVIAAEQTSGALGFAILNGVNTPEAGAMDGIVLNCSLDAGRTPTASAIFLERIGELSDDATVDDARIAALGATDPVAPPGSVPDDLARHLVRDIGPAALAAGGDWLLHMPVARSLSRGLPPGTIRRPLRTDTKIG
jgi:transcriptional regulator with XRE-family HTH domain